VALREDQIQRYSRHILLKEVGGIGQAKLLNAAVQVVGSSEAIGVAVAYLAAAGTQIVSEHSFSGFLFQKSVSDLNPDAKGTHVASIVLCDADVADSKNENAEIIRVNIHKNAVTWQLPNGPPAEKRHVESEANNVSLGSAAALVIQRIILGFEMNSGRLQFLE
jgi:hypothetical protein